MPDEQSLLDAHYRVVQYYLDYLRSAQKAYLQGNESAAYALAMFDQEREQVKQWQAWIVAHAGQDDRAAAFCSDFASASMDIFKLRLQPQEYFSWLEAALEAARRLGDRRAEATHLLGLCAMSGRIKEYQQQIDYVQQALSIARQMNDQPMMAQSFNLYGNATRDRMDFEEAQAYYEQSLALYRTIGDRKGIAEILNNLGVLAIHRRNNEAAQDYLEQSLIHYRAIGNQEGVATSLNNLGFLALRVGDYPAAGDYLEQAQAIFQMMEDKQGIAINLCNLGTAAYYQEEYARAQEYLEQGLVAIQAVGVWEREVTCLYKLGQVAMAQGDLPLARDYFQQSLAACHTRVTSPDAPVSLSNLAIIYLRLQQEDLAYASLAEALNIANNLPGAQATLRVLVAAARVWVLRSKPLSAATWLGLVENHPHPSVKMTEIKRDVQVARAECAAAIAPEQFAAAWEEGKTMNLDSIVTEILGELESS